MKRPKLDIEIVGTDSLEPASYNPREAEDYKLELVKLSLLKFGFLSPIYATLQGEILSGHQRHFVSKELSLDKVPVCFLSQVNEQNKKYVNIVFNRATNDLLDHDTAQSVSIKLRPDKIKSELSDLPDLSKEKIITRCLNYEYVNTQKLAETNLDRLSHHKTSRRVSRFLFKIGAYLPIIIDKQLHIINGKERLKAAVAQGYENYPVIKVDTQKTEALYSLFNYLTMSFTIHKEYADMLRYNSYRRRLIEGRYKVSLALVIGLGRNMQSKDFDLSNQSIKDKFERTYGNCILDFGAGQLRDTRYLQNHGVTCIPFEPFYTNQTNHINKEASLQIVRGFLSTLRKKVQFSSITLGAVFNSVPFIEDCKHIVVIIAALTSRDQAVVYSVTRSTKDVKHIQSDGYRGDNTFFINSELTLGEFTRKPKAQRYFSPQRFYELFKNEFEIVLSYETNGVTKAIAKKPKPVNKDVLDKSLEFEFDLPYPDGSRMGLVQEAKEAFYKYLGI